jgi:predicted nucleic acid-binding Zn ribbon protein
LSESRYKDGQRMKDAMQSYLKALGIDQKVHEGSVLAKWGEIMGEAVEKRTEKKYIKERVLHIHVNSSVIRDELFQKRTEIIEKINSISGYDIIDDIYLA